jgi:hypothetical protein
MKRYRNIRPALTYANVMATVAAFVALGGSSYAALTITGKHVRDGSLTGRDVHNGSLTSRDIRNGSLSVKDFKTGELPCGAVQDAGTFLISSRAGRYTAQLTGVTGDGVIQRPDAGAQLAYNGRQCFELQSGTTVVAHYALLDAFSGGQVGTMDVTMIQGPGGDPLSGGNRRIDCEASQGSCATVAGYIAILADV